MRAKDLLKLTTKGDPLRPVFVHTAEGGERALLNSVSGEAQVEIDGEMVEVLVISAVVE